MRAADPTLSQPAIAKALGCSQQNVSKATTKTSQGEKKVVCPEWLTSDTHKATFRKLTPEDQERVRAAGRGSLRGIAIAAGIVKVPSVLERLRKLWAKASKEERAAFMEVVGNG
jgi:hypothetical protein